MKKKNFMSKGKKISVNLHDFFFFFLYTMLDDIYFNRQAIYQNGIAMDISNT